MMKHKDNLAKLLATENVTVQYRNCQTAMFDVENRVITLPIFKNDLSEPLLDLFIGHEVSHALHTPLEGLHETVSDRPVLKGYLNVIEDVRIEKMIKAKYPGLKVNMKKGYAELMDMDFFGVKQMGDDHVLSLIDKINLTTKVGEFLMLDFTDEERAFLDRAYLVETWDDVVALATEIYEWSQENENKEDDQPEYEDEQEEGDIPNETSGEGEEEGDSEEGSSDQYEEGDATDYIESNIPSAGEDARNAMTEEYAHRFEEMKLRDNDSDVLNIPSDYFDHWKPEHRIQSNQMFIEQIQHYKKDNLPMINHIAKKLESKNKKIISLMVKEYEIKKAGSLYARARTAKTGAIDTLKLAKYQIVEDMFKRATIVPEGKSHGIICYIDWSGSMDKVAYSALEQAYIVAKFCRQVSIPHRIFLFTSHSSYETSDFYNEGGNGHMIEVYSNKQTNRQFLDSSLVLSALIAYSCRTDFWNQNKAMRNDFMNDYAPLLEYYESGDRHYGGWMLLDELFPYPPNLLRMGGTPLNGLLHTARYLLREQKSKYNLDFQNLILVTDGFSNKMDLPKYDAYGSGYHSGRGSRRTMYTDPFTKRVYDLRLAGDGLTGTMGMVDYVKQETGASVTGYFIVRNKNEFSDFYWHIGWTFDNSSRVFEKANPSDEKWKECTKQGGVNLTGTTFDKLLFVKSITATGDDTLDEELVGAARGKIKTAFSKNASSKIKSRFIVNQMIEGLQI